MTISLLCFSIFTMAEETVKGAHPFKVDENEQVASDFSHWSIIPHVGFNAFDGDFNSEMQHPIGLPSAGLDIEYAFTPVWALGVEYMFDWYKVTGKPGNDNAETLLNGYMHKAGAYVSMDFMNLFYPHATKKICGIQAIAGGGYAWYRNTVMYPDEYRYHTGTHQPLSMDKYKGALFLQAGLNVEFNLNRTLALGVRATYSYFINDYPDGRGYSGMQSLASKNNDGIVDVTLNMRFKLMAVSKTHVRNISSVDDVLAPIKEKEFNDKVDSAIATACSGRDTVIIYRDTVIKQLRETRTRELLGKDNDQYYYVYFDNNKDVIKEDGLITIQQVADRMAEDPSLYAVVTGYCDNTGSNALNFSLGDRRANNVIEELREEHGIEPDHMYSTGLGKLVGRRSTGAYGPNRRAAIRLVDKATFDRMKVDLENKRANRVDEDGVNVPAVQTVPFKETTPKEVRQDKQMIEYRQRTNQEVVTDKNTTLSKLARQFYGNTYCWVYIYIANKDRIKNPNALVPGTTLIIPELTEKEMRITKDEGLVLYYDARQNR